MGEEVVVVVVEEVYVVEKPAEKQEVVEEDAFLHSGKASSSCCIQSGNLEVLHYESYEVHVWGSVRVQGNVSIHLSHLVKVVLQAAIAYCGGGDGGDDGYHGAEEEVEVGELEKVSGCHHHLNH